MRNGYAAINNFSKLGEMGISHRAFETIAQIAANNVSGAHVKEKSSSAFSLDKPVKATIRKDGRRVDIHLDVIIKKGANVDDVCRSIHEEVASAIQMCCETIPFEIQTRVVAIK
jgi:uncharacterized alkaline shock family protein YloU